MEALINKTHLKGALIGRRALNRITVLEAILTGKQLREKIQCCVQFFFLLGDYNFLGKIADKCLENLKQATGKI